MRFLTVRELRGGSSQVWDELARQGEMVVTSNGKPVAILSPVRETDFEETLSAIRRARAVMSVTALQRESHDQGTDRLTLDEINAEIAEARRANRPEH